MFSWPISSPFSVLYVDMCIHVCYTDTSSYMTLMNDICDMSQFVVVVSVPDKSSATLASYFMQHVLMKFGLYHLIVLYHGSPFKRSFITMCKALNLSNDVFAKHNHKGFTVEHFYRFLNKRVIIAAEERGTNDIFVPVGITAGYA